MKKSMKNNGLDDNDLTISDDAIEAVIGYYTREAGVRKLEQQIGKICRKAVKKLLENTERPIEVTKQNLEEYLGKERFHFEK